MPYPPSPRQALAMTPAAHGVHGAIAVPPSKSVTQRALVAAALAGGGATVRRPLDAEDPRLLFEALRSAGCLLEWRAGDVVASGWAPAAGGDVTMGNNGTGARFMLAQLAATAGVWTLDGVARLRERPFTALVRALTDLGAEIAPLAGSTLGLPLRITGRRLDGGEVDIDAGASSQFVSALLLLGARLPRGLIVRLAQSPPSRPYLTLTSEVLKAFGVDAGYDDRSLQAWVAPGQPRPTTVAVEGDWSAAAFPLAAVAVVGGRISLPGLAADSRQGDAVMLGLVETAGCRVSASTEAVVVEGPAVRPVHADLRDAPDLFPALAVVVAALGGELTGLEGLAAKESDRLSLMAANLSAIGFEVAAGGGALRAPGSLPRRATTTASLPCAGDHRIAMALAVAGSAVPGVSIDDAGCVAKSWPGFWAAWGALVAGGS
jgi:3-phosphoshikimate 1-carboxyvinyltransferase